MEDGGEAAVRAQSRLWVGGDHDQRLGGSPELDVVDAACSGTQWRRFAAGRGEDDIVLLAGDINWTYALGLGVLDPFACGATGGLYAGPRDPAIWPTLIERTGATIFAAVPGLYRQILKYGDPSTHDLSCLRHGVCAGEALSPTCSPVGATRPGPGSTRPWA